MNSPILNNSYEDFILKYKTAIKEKLTRQQLAQYLGVKVKSILRKRLKIKEFTGLELDYLVSEPSSELTPEIIKRYEDSLKYFEKNIRKSEKVNNITQKTRVEIRKNKRYVITSAQNATPINRNFLKSIHRYCEHNDAELLVIPYRYKNPTSVWTINGTEQNWWNSEITPFIMADEYKVGKYVRVMGNIKIQPTATSPLSGFDTVTDIDSAIFGHPNVEWKTIASIPGSYPKILTTTGSITVPNYTDSKAGHKGAYHHTYGAIVLEIDEDELFYIRHISADNKGGFYDLDSYYAPTYVKTGQRVAAIVAGDIHAEQIDEEVADVLFRSQDSLSNILDPKNIILHDLLDFGVRSHWNERDALGRFARHIFSQDDNVEEAFQCAADFIETITRVDCTNHIIPSNHLDHVTRWLKEGSPETDPENARIFYYLKYHQYRCVEEGKKFDPFEFWCSNPDTKKGMSDFVHTKTHFMHRDDPLEICECEVSLHGDIGPNGSRGSLRNLSRLGQRVICGHSHTPGIMNGSLQVGTTSKIFLQYNKGPSSWLHTSAVIYPSGAATLITIVNGKWKL